MKKIILILAVLLCAAPVVSAQSARDILGGLLGGGSNQQTDSTSTGSNSGSGLGDLIGGVAGMLGIGNKDVDIKSLAGTWNYKKPAVSFKSDNLLLKAGGVATASAVESKLETYYNRFGLNKLVLVIEADSSFTMTAGRIKASGTITSDPKSGETQFHFKALGKVNIGSMTAYIKLTGNNMELTFDVSKLITLIEKLSAISGNSSIKSLSSLLSSYDGLTAGFELTKQK